MCTSSDQNLQTLETTTNSLADFHAQAGKYVVEHNSRAASDSAAFAHDSKIYPRPAFNHRGEPRWPDSVAEKLLCCQDMDEGKHNTMTPKALHESHNKFHEK
jgi:hypothetical protein